MAEERLQKIIAAAGVTSRRKAEELITEGRVQVNGAVVTELGTKAELGRDHIRVDGKLLQGAEQHRYYMLNKPKGFVTTVSDPENRPTVMKFFERAKGRVYPVGRLDYLSEGLLLMTNDGELANLLTKASTGIEKTYLVKVSGQPTPAAIEQLRSGVMIEKGRAGTREGRVMTAPAEIRLVKPAENPWYEIILIEGRNRELRKMFEEVGHHVEKIRRIGFGPLVLDVPPGEVRELGEDEVEALKRSTRPGARKRVTARKMVADGLAVVTKPRSVKRTGPAAGKAPAKRAGGLGGKTSAPRSSADRTGAKSRPAASGRKRP
jgi:23S rRNA pseudouridine2605 synthase